MVEKYWIKKLFDEGYIDGTDPQVLDAIERLRDAQNSFGEWVNALKDAKINKFDPCPTGLAISLIFDHGAQQSSETYLVFLVLSEKIRMMENRIAELEAKINR